MEEKCFMDIRAYLKTNRLLCDGAFGTYYVNTGGKCSKVEMANTQDAETVVGIHKKYIDAGAHLIRTNTFASNKAMLECSESELKANIRAGYNLAVKAASEYEDVYVAADIGPASPLNVFDYDEIKKEYLLICETFINEGAEILMFETMPSLENISEVIKEIKDKNDVFIIVQFCVNQYGYSNAGRSAASLLREVSKMPQIDAVGFNCGVGPVHLYNILSRLNLPENKYITALPNAGYPQLMQNRMVFINNAEYFVNKELEIAGLGVNMLGGCCGTTPEHIRMLSSGLNNVCDNTGLRISIMESHNGRVANKAFFADKPKDKKLIAVELAPPLGADDEKIMDAANLVKDSGVDVVTFPDSPSGRTRADSILMAVKIHEATGMTVMPHICCRDKNAIAIRSQILGAYMNDIHNLLILTGDPVPTMIRQNVKSVFNFDSVGLMKIVNDMNSEEFLGTPMVFGGVINYDRLHLEVEIKRVKAKMAAGARFFFTQPVFTIEDAMKVKRIKEETGAMILCGIMPLVSRKNAVFIKNEMTGIRVTEEIIRQFDENMTREESEGQGVKIALKIMDAVKDFTDGYYFSFPFNRVYLLDMIKKQTIPFQS